MSDIRRTVVVEMSDVLYRELARTAVNGGRTLGELLIGSACLTECNRRGARGDLAGWRRLMRAWQCADPAAPDVALEGLFEEEAADYWRDPVEDPVREMREQ